MPLTGVKLRFDEVITLGMNTNSSGALTSSLDVREATLIALLVVGKTGTHASHIITLQSSPNDTDWFDMTDTLTGDGVLHDVSCACKFIRAKVTTPEGGTSTCDVYIQIK